jgi:hypothetical protein
MNEWNEGVYLRLASSRLVTDDKHVLERSRFLPCPSIVTFCAFYCVVVTIYVHVRTCIVTIEFINLLQKVKPSSDLIYLLGTRKEVVPSTILWSDTTIKIPFQFIRYFGCSALQLCFTRRM